MEMEDSEKSSGLCMEAEEVMYWCTAGTQLGEKLSAAMMTCSKAEEDEGRRRGRSARRERSAREKEKETVRSVSLLRRLRLGSWRNTQASFVSSLSLVGWITRVTSTT